MDISLLKKHEQDIKKFERYLKEQISLIKGKNDVIFKENTLRRGYDEQNRYNDETLVKCEAFLNEVVQQKKRLMEEIETLKDIFRGKIPLPKGRCSEARRIKENKRKVRATSWKRTEGYIKSFINKCFGPSALAECFPGDLKDTSSKKVLHEKDILTHIGKPSKTDGKVIEVLVRKKALTEGCKSKLMKLLRVKVDPQKPEGSKGSRKTKRYLKDLNQRTEKAVKKMGILTAGCSSGQTIEITKVRPE